MCGDQHPPVGDLLQRNIFLCVEMNMYLLETNTQLGVETNIYLLETNTNLYVETNIYMSGFSAQGGEGYTVLQGPVPPHTFLEWGVRVIILSYGIFLLFKA